MSDEIYEQLWRRVNEHGIGFAKTTSGVEIRFLRRLFTEEEAKAYMLMRVDLETPEQIAKRNGLNAEPLAALLKRMAVKGLVFPKRDGAKCYYAAAPFVHGLVEHQVARMDKEFAQIQEEWMWAEKVPDPQQDIAVGVGTPLRTVPVHAPIAVSRPIAPYEDVRNIILKQERIALADCYCAVQQHALDTGCKQPREVCMLLGFYADYYIDLGLGRRITQAEALEILDKSEAAGLVHQVPNSQDPGAICNCCPDCCGQLRSLKALPNPGAIVTTDHFAEVLADLCNACEACVERCSMDAIAMSDAMIAQVNRDRCIGCALCISICPTEALVLAAKADRPEPGFTTPFMRSSQDIESSIR